MGRRRDRLNKRQALQISTRRENSTKKELERARRADDMKAILKKGSLPYAPGVMSWLSAELDKKASKITAEDVQGLLA